MSEGENLRGDPGGPLEVPRVGRLEAEVLGRVLVPRGVEDSGEDEAEHQQSQQQHGGARVVAEGRALEGTGGEGRSRTRAVHCCGVGVVREEVQCDGRAVDGGGDVDGMSGAVFFGAEAVEVVETEEQTRQADG